MWVLEHAFIIIALSAMCAMAFYLNLFMIKERELIKNEYQNFPIMKLIKAKDLMSGDIFKVNPRLPKEHWVDTVINKFNHVQITTWSRTTLSMNQDDIVFLIRSTNPERNGKK